MAFSNSEGEPQARHPQRARAGERKDFFLGVPRILLKSGVNEWHGYALENSFNRKINVITPSIRFYTGISGDLSDNLFMNLLSGFNAILLIWLYDDCKGKEVAIEVPPKAHINGRIGVP